MVCLAITFFLVNGRAKVYAAAVLFIGIPLVFYFRDNLFGQYIEMTAEQFKYGDNIRERSAEFWLNEYWPHWITKLIGNGTPHILSAYGIEMEKIRDTFHYYRTDVGIIGAYNEYGALYVLNILWLNFVGLKSKFYSDNTKYLKLLFIYTTILLLTTEYYSHLIGMPFYCLLFYLVDKSYEEKKAKVVRPEISLEEQKLT
jgi:hypothetical protein